MTQNEPALDERRLEAGEMLDALRWGVCVCDHEGLILSFNRTAAEYWRRTPKLRDPQDRFCGSHRLYRPDGAELAREEWPAAEVLHTGRAVRDRELVIGRGDGSRLSVLVSVEAIKDRAGLIVGAVSSLIPRRLEADAATRLSAIVESSDDAIVGKDTEGVINSWNTGAERLFGYAADEVVGRHISIIIPKDRLNEEDEILRRIRLGERVDHFETVRRRKDGGLIDISLTVSPIRNLEGEITGASKIARDITERTRAQEQQRLLLREMNHRIKNLFALAGSIVALSARPDSSTDDVVGAVQKRLSALALAHSLTLPDLAAGDTRAEKQTTLRALARAVLSPYEREQSGEGRFSIEGPDLSITGASLTSFALLLHEAATNAVKYGALSSEAGRVDIVWWVAEEDLVLSWRELGGPRVYEPHDHDGFGTTLANAAITHLGGRLSRDWNPEGLRITLVIPLSAFTNSKP